MKELSEGKGPGVPQIEFTQAPIYIFDPRMLPAIQADYSGTAIAARMEQRERGKALLFTKRGRAELERRGVTEAQLDALRAEMVRDEEPEV